MATKTQAKSAKSTGEARPKAGRPPAKIDEDTLLKLAQIHCTQEDIAHVMGVSERTIIKRLKEEPLKSVWERGKAMGRSSLRRLMWKHAQMPNSAGGTMSIHLSKHWLGMTEKAALELSGRVDGTIDANITVRDRIAGKLDTLAERIARRVDGVAKQAGAKLVPEDAE